jgi:methylmalonyl-CoA mutase
MAAMDDFRLAPDSPAATFEDWLKAVEKALKGAPFDSLRIPLYEGFATEPLYVQGNGAGSCAARGARPSRVIQLADHDRPEEARAQLADDLANGVTGFWLQFGGNLPYGGGVLGARTASELADMLAPAVAGRAALYVSGGADALAGTAALIAAARRLNWSPESLCGSAGLDPLAVIAASGEIPANRSEIMAGTVDAAHFLGKHGFGLKPFLVSARAWHQAGGSAVEELAFALSAAVSYWRALAASGWPSKNAASAIDFIFPADADLFLTIAKFRAARLIWSRALEAAGVEEAARSTEFLAEMSYRMLTERDAHVNILRGTAAAFAAGIGGADGALILPFDGAFGESAAFSRRLARNASLILQHESHLHRVADAASGSFYVERLTEQLCRESWSLFQQIEAGGGLIGWLADGRAARRLAALRAERDLDIARCKHKITGVSAFPNLSEKIEARRLPAPGSDPDILVFNADSAALPKAGSGERFTALVSMAEAGAAVEDIERACRTVYEPVPPIGNLARRSAQPFEALRRASDIALTRVGSRPPIFVALIGAREDCRARAAFVESFFAAGGVQAILPERGFDDAEAIARAFALSPAPVACLCSSDEGYAALPGAALALKRANTLFLYLAGPQSALAKLDPADRRAVDRIIHEECNAAELLAELHQILRVADMGHMDFGEDEIGDEEDFAGPAPDPEKWEPVFG